MELPWRRRSDEDFACEIRANIAIDADELVAGGMSRIVTGAA